MWQENKRDAPAKDRDHLQQNMSTAQLTYLSRFSIVNAALSCGGRDMPVINSRLHPHVFAVGGGDSRGGWLFKRRCVRCAGGNERGGTEDNDTIDEKSVIVVVVVAFDDVVGGSGDEGTEMQSLAFFGVVKIASVVTANFATPPPG